MAGPVVITPRGRDSVAQTLLLGTLGQSLSALSSLGVGLMETQRQKELASIDTALKLVGGDPNALPGPARAKLAKRAGLGGLQLDTEGFPTFPKTAAEQAKVALAEFTKDVAAKAQAGDPSAVSAMRVLTGVEQPSPSAAELDIRREEIDVKRESARARVQAASISAAADKEVARINAEVEREGKAALRRPSGFFLVGSQMVPAEKLTNVLGQQGLDPSAAKALSVEDAQELLEIQKATADKRKLEAEAAELNATVNRAATNMFGEMLPSLVKLVDEGVPGASKAASGIITDIVERSVRDLGTDPRVFDPGPSRFLSFFGRGGDTPLMKAVIRGARARNLPAPGTAGDLPEIESVDARTGEVRFTDEAPLPARAPTFAVPEGTIQSFMQQAVARGFSRQEAINMLTADLELTPEAAEQAGVLFDRELRRQAQDVQ